MTNDEQALRKRIEELEAKIAKLEAENAYLETIKDPLRDNIGWSPVSDLTCD
jgi:BMFP domain-containing protein YqiC